MAICRNTDTKLSKEVSGTDAAWALPCCRPISSEFRFRSRTVSPSPRSSRSVLIIWKVPRFMTWANCLLVISRSIVLSNLWTSWQGSLETAPARPGDPAKTETGHGTCRHRAHQKFATADGSCSWILHFSSPGSEALQDGPPTAPFPACGRIASAGTGRQKTGGPDRSVSCRRGSSSSPPAREKTERGEVHPAPLPMVAATATWTVPLMVSDHSLQRTPIKHPPTAKGLPWLGSGEATVGFRQPVHERLTLVVPPRVTPPESMVYHLSKHPEAHDGRGDLKG